PFRFAGQYRDAESTLYYLRARYYDPGIEQFISRDPEFEKTRQAYAYVADNPVNHTDPTGLSSVGVCETYTAGAGAGVTASVCVVSVTDGSISQDAPLELRCLGGDALACAIYATR